MLPRPGRRVAGLGSLCWYGSNAWAPTKARPDETLIRALARAHRWNRMLEEGRYCSAQEIADAEKIGRSFVSRRLRLTLLAPDIQEAILEGRQGKGVQLEELIGAVPAAWVSSPGEGIPTEMIPLGFIRRAQQQHDPAQRTRRP